MAVFLGGLAGSPWQDSRDSRWLRDSPANREAVWRCRSRTGRAGLSAGSRSPHGPGTVETAAGLPSVRPEVKYRSSCSALFVKRAILSRMNSSAQVRKKLGVLRVRRGAGCLFQGPCGPHWEVNRSRGCQMQAPRCLGSLVSAPGCLGAWCPPGGSSLPTSAGWLRGARTQVVHEAGSACWQ